MATAAGALAGTAKAASFGNPDSPGQGAVNVKNPRALADPGPYNPALTGQFPSAVNPPPTDVGSPQMTWASFNNAPRRVQNGGWARQVTASTFPISTTISGVNMRLGPGGIRELHWHQHAEWAYMTYGGCRVTVIDPQGRPYVADVKEGDIWYFPAGYPHSLQGLGPDGCEFVICFDDGEQSEYNTLLVSDWFLHTPPSVLAQNFGVPADTFSRMPLNDLWIFQGKVPGDLASVRAKMQGSAGNPPFPFTWPLADSRPVSHTAGGKLQIVDSTSFRISTTIAVALVTIKPGALRQLHWHPNADEWQYYIKGRARMGVFNTGPNVLTMDFTPGDIGYVKKNFGHYVQNVGDTDVQFFAVFRAPEYQEFSLSDWLKHSPPEMVAEHFNIDPSVIANWPDGSAGVIPGV